HGDHRADRRTARRRHVVRRPRRPDLVRDQAEVAEGAEPAPRRPDDRPHRGRPHLRHPPGGVARGPGRRRRRPRRALAGGAEPVGALHGPLHRGPAAAGRADAAQPGRGAARRRAGPLVGPPQARAAAHAGGRRGAAAGERPRFTTDLARLEEAARGLLAPQAFGYVAGSAGSGSTARANRAAFERWRIVPRMLRDVAERDLSTEVLGTPMPAPVLLAPTGVQTIVHPEGELASARAAAELGLVYIRSTAAAHSIEQAAEASGDGPRWYQLYWPKDPEVAASLVQRAEAAGYRAIVV